MLPLSVLIIQLVEAGLEVTPSIMQAWKTEVSLSSQTTPLTPEQQAQLDAALEEANNALQAA